jgi:inner membrane protein
MSPVTHFLAGWVLSAASPVPLTRREKALVTVAAVAPDLDGLGLIPELLTRNSSHPLLWFSQYHHSLHTLLFSLIMTMAALLIDGPFRNFTLGPKIQGRSDPAHPWLAGALVFFSFHLHLLCDLAGARGPDGYQWPIPYLQPFSHALELSWHGQWPLNAWPNFVITLLLLLTTLCLAITRGTTPIELFSPPANRAVVTVLRKRLAANISTNPE